jgi:hypothetical protein
MPVELQGFAAALCRTGEFRGVTPGELEPVLSNCEEPLHLRIAAGGVGEPIIRSGNEFTHLVFVQQGTLLPWQYPPSELVYPFLIGGHELLMESSRWMATYSATPDAVIVEVPVGMIQRVVEALPLVRTNLERIVLRRLSRFYWTSLSTNGTPAARVAAALISRLALDGEDWGEAREVDILQTELMRLTVLSRTAVADGTRQLEETGLIDTGGRRYFSGRVKIPAVDALKEIALADARDVIRARYDVSSR